MFDVQGRRVTVLLEGEVSPGWGEVSWNGLDSEGKRVGAGVYFVRFEAGQVQQTRKLVQLR